MLRIWWFLSDFLVLATCLISLMPVSGFAESHGFIFFEGACMDLIEVCCESSKSISHNQNHSILRHVYIHMNAGYQLVANKEVASTSKFSNHHWCTGYLHLLLGCDVAKTGHISTCVTSILYILCMVRIRQLAKFTMSQWISLPKVHFPQFVCWRTMHVVSTSS